MNPQTSDNDGQTIASPRVTIGLPTYNRPEGLKKSLDHILKQTYPNLEIIISDNCSTDDRVQKVIQEYAAKDSRINATRQKTNIGLEENFNFVFDQSTADYFIWMSDDDYFDANYITECMKVLSGNPDYVLCSGVAKYYSEGQFLFTEKMFLVNQEKSFSRLFKYFSAVHKNGNFYGVFKRRLLLQKPIGVHIGCDWSFMAKLAILGKLTFTIATNYHRSAAGNSETRKKMIRKFGFNKLQALFFETYSAYCIASNIFTDSAVKARFNYLERKIVSGIIFLQINYKLLMNFIKKKMGIPIN